MNDMTYTRSEPMAQHFTPEATIARIKANAEVDDKRKARADRRYKARAEFVQWIKSQTRQALMAGFPEWLHARKITPRMLNRAYHQWRAA